MLTHTSHSIRDLRNDEDEMLRGVQFVCFSCHS